MADARIEDVLDFALGHLPWNGDMPMPRVVLASDGRFLVFAKDWHATVRYQPGAPPQPEIRDEP